MRILLMGNPNVGKSAVFSRLTGVHVVTSNYPGTTVEFMEGKMYVGREKVEIIDVPGIYTLEPVSKAEEVALEMLKKGDLVINILDSTNIGRSLNLTLELIKRRIPLIIALNLWDEAKHIGIKINVDRLKEILKVSCIPICAITGEGFKELVSKIPEAKVSSFEFNEKKKWQEIGRITNEVEVISHRHHTFTEQIVDASLFPSTGIPIAIIVIFITFQIIRFIGEGLAEWIFRPLFTNIWIPLISRISVKLQGIGFWHEILIGDLIKGKIDLESSLGLLTTGVFIPIGAVLPYILAFYLVISFLEDSGYLPRLAILVDNVMHRLGLHGMAIISIMLAFGCNVPGVLSTRIMETKRERFIAACLMSISIPCMAQIAMIAGLLGRHGVFGLSIVLGILFLVWIILGISLNRFLKGESMEIFMEIPPYRIPYLPSLLKKVWMRILWFLREALPWVFLGVFFANILENLGIIGYIGNFSTPLISGILGLPKEAVGALILGLFRKDVAVGMLMPLKLTFPQLIIASVVLTLYFPCVATFATLVKELGIKDMFKAVIIMISSSLFIGGVLNIILSR